MSLSRPSPERFDTSARSSSSMLQGQSFVPSPVFAAHDTPTSEQGVSLSSDAAPSAIPMAPVPPRRTSAPCRRPTDSTPPMHGQRPSQRPHRHVTNVPLCRPSRNIPTGLSHRYRGPRRNAASSFSLL